MYVYCMIYVTGGQAMPPPPHVKLLTPPGCCLWWGCCSFSVALFLRSLCGSVMERSYCWIGYRDDHPHTQWPTFAWLGRGLIFFFLCWKSMGSRSWLALLLSDWSRGLRMSRRPRGHRDFPRKLAHCVATRAPPPPSPTPPPPPQPHACPLYC